MNEDKALPIVEKNEIIVYQPKGGEFHIEVRVENETVWLTQAQMAELFCKNQSVIARHIQNAFKEGEVSAESNMHILHNTLSKYKPTTIYSLDVIISVGYRVKSANGVKFRRWANQVLKEHLLQGFSVNQRLVSHENRLENLDSRLRGLTSKRIKREATCGLAFDSRSSHARSAMTKRGGDDKIALSSHSIQKNRLANIFKPNRL